MPWSRGLVQAAFVALCTSHQHAWMVAALPPHRVMTMSATGPIAGPANPRALVGEGMNLFRAGDVKGSVAKFDQAIDADPRYANVLWQRGLSLYYADLFELGAQQFRRDVADNPNDTEEALWTLLCEARMPGLGGFSGAQERLLKVGRDPRPYMRVVYDVFAGRATEEDLAAEGHRGGSGSGPEFYAQLYLGLLAEAQGNETKAKYYISSAASSPYGQRSKDYMWSLARVHKQVRGW